MRIWVRNMDAKEHTEAMERTGESVCPTKRDIRTEVLKRRAGLSHEERKIASIRIAERIIGHQWFYQSEYVLIFANYGSEIDTTEIITEALQKGKKVYLPKVVGNDMDFYRITSLEELQNGYKGIPEPVCCEERFPYSDEMASKTVMIMPGVAFDPYKNRIGYGRGYYDRYLAAKKLLQLRTIAIGFQCQIVAKLPGEEYDIRPYQVIVV